MCVSTAKKGKKKTFLVKVVDSQRCGAPRLTLAGPLRVCSASPRSTAKKEKPPRVSADRCCWARHTQEGCCCHTQMHETVNLSGLYEMLGRERGEGGRGGHVFMQGWKCIPWALPFPLGSLPSLSSSPHPAQASRPPHRQRRVNVAGGSLWG